MSSTVPPATRIEESFELDAWDIPDLDADVDTSAAARPLPAPAPPVRLQPPAIGASAAMDAAPPAASPPGATKPKASESTARAAAPPSSRVVQPPPLPGRRRSSPEAAPASSVARAPSETRPRAATPSPTKEWLRLEPSAEARRASPERGIAKASGATSAGTNGPTSAPAVPAPRPWQSGPGAPADEAGDVPVARASSAMRATERPQGTAVPPPANVATPPPLPAGFAAPPPLPAGHATPPPLPAGFAAPPPLPAGHATPPPLPAGQPAPPSRPQVMPAAQGEPAASGPRAVEDAGDVEPESTRVVAVPTTPPRPAPSAAGSPVRRVATPAPETTGVAASSVKAAPAPKPAPSSPKVEPPPPTAKAVEAPTVSPAAEVTAARALPAEIEVVTTAPVADGGWLAPIIEPGTDLEDIERHEANMLLDFDADLLPNAGEQPRNVPGQGSGESICTFWLGPDCFGLDVQLVSEVLLVDDILPVPWAPPALLGLINSRGRIVPVVSLATLLGVSSAAAPEPMAVSQASPAILIKADSLLAAALVDRPGLVIQLDRAGLIPTERESAEPWVKGHLRPDDRTHPAVTLLDPERLVQRFLDVSRFPDIRSCLASGGYRPARAASAQRRGLDIS